MPRYDDEDDDRPRRRLAEDDEDDDEDDRPRRKRKRKPAGPPTGVILALAGVAGLLLLVFFGLVGYFVLSSDKPAQQAFRPVVAPVAVPPAPVVAPPPAPAPAGQNQVTITGVRRATGFAGKPVLEIDYQLTGGFVPGRAVVLIKSREGTTEANVFGPLGMGPGGNSGTWKLEKFGFGGFNGRLEVWVEQRFGPTGGIISNTFVVE